MPIAFDSLPPCTLREDARLRLIAVGWVGVSRCEGADARATGPIQLVE